MPLHRVAIRPTFLNVFIFFVSCDLSRRVLLLFSSPKQDSVIGDERLTRTSFLITSGMVYPKREYVVFCGAEAIITAKRLPFDEEKKTCLAYFGVNLFPMVTTVPSLYNNFQNMLVRILMLGSCVYVVIMFSPQNFEQK